MIPFIPRKLPITIYVMRKTLSGVLAAACIGFLLLPALNGQAHPRKSEREAAGDTPANPPALAHLSPAFKSKAIEAAMRKVGDWQMKKSRADFNQDWTYAALYAGYMAASKALPDPRYEKAMLDMGNEFDWKLGPRLAHADDQAIGQTYLELYKDYHQPGMILPTEKQFDELMKMPDNPNKPVWWWCDALFMAPPVWVRLYSATGNRAYLNYMDHEWWITSNLLYDPQEHLYFRDATYLHKHEPNGRKLFWSRGNGWVMAGLARVLDEMPKDYPTRQKYVDQFQQMAARVASIQSPDGLWRPGLLDPDAYPLPEVSGSGFFVYALAWGVDRGILVRAIYLPVVKKGWAGLVSHVYIDGRLGCIQPIGAAPGQYQVASSYVYGVGAFLLAGSEVDRLAQGRGVHKIHRK
jgi:rhamnogalacturonyl hydrolase YesR